MDIDTDLVDNIKACRTCGIHYVTPSKHQLKHLFQSSLDNSEIMLIRLELSQWSVEVAENDGLPQHICNTCIHKFEQVFELRAACINAQNEFRKFYAVPNGNISSVKIKTELPGQDEEQAICDFIYVDDLSDEEYDGATPFNFPHIPIKEEVIEAATVPREELEQTTNMVESASKMVMQKEVSSSQITEHNLQNKSVTLGEPAAVSQIAIEEVECVLCQHISPNQEEHGHHMQRVHEIRNFECHICGKEFKNTTASRLKFHMKWHTLNKHVKCNLCGFVCNSKDSLREHKQANHRKLNCKICGKGVLAKKMKSHLRHHELLSKYSCEYCAEAFATENERENHIWQIHANEDNNTFRNSKSIFQSTCNQTVHENLVSVPQQEITCREPQHEVLYKYVCAHCEHRFIEQIDLETHVNEEHRIHSHRAPIAPQTAEVAQDVQDHNINVFEEYENVPRNNSSLCNTVLLPNDFNFPSSSSNFLTQSESMPNINTGTISNISYKEPERSESEDETNVTLPSYIDDSNFNTFACAKCSETFVTIEQLRQHHNEHLADDLQHQSYNAKPKLKFTCNFCEKSFDLKFSLNRHMKKHKYAPI